MSAETLVLAILATAKEDWSLSPVTRGEISAFLASDWFNDACFLLGLEHEETRRAIIGYRAPMSPYHRYVKETLKKRDPWAGLGKDYIQLRLTGKRR